jgi:hypothetical protein
MEASAGEVGGAYLMSLLMYVRMPDLQVTAC